MDVRERIAAVLASHRPTGCPVHCGCGDFAPTLITQSVWEGHVADVLVSELGLVTPRCETCGVSYGHASGCVEQLT
jgi:hypothetical protein